MTVHLAIIFMYLCVTLFVASTIGIGLLITETAFSIFCRVFGNIDNKIRNH